MTMRLDVVRRHNHGRSTSEWHVRVRLPKPSTLYLEESIKGVRKTMCGQEIWGGARFSVIDLEQLTCEGCRVALAAFMLAKVE